METIKKCNKLIKKYYVDKGITLKDNMLDAEIRANISSGSKILDAGCGADAAVLSKYCNLVGKAIGVDLAKAFNAPPKIETYTANLESLPFENGYFDVIISKDVVEHLKNPVKVFKELKRVLKPGGKIIALTPNRYSYVSIISGFLPTSLKNVYLKKVFGESAYDNFPTFYNCNTKHSIRKIARESGLMLDKFLSIRHYPYYLMFSEALFRIGILYDKAISVLRLDFLKNNFLFVLVKK